MVKRIALIGNLNNNFFAITRLLRDNGYDAHLFFRSGQDHFHPKADTYDLSYVNYCHEVNWLDKGFHNVDKENVLEDVKGFDFYIGQGDEAATAYYAGINMDVYYPYGSDVFKYAHLKQEYSFRDKLLSQIRMGKKTITYKQMQRGTLAKYTKGVIVNSREIFSSYWDDIWEERFDALNCGDKRRYVSMPFLYATEYEQLHDTHFQADAHWKSYVDTLRNKYKFIVLYHGRQEWNASPVTAKKSHHLILGFASFLKNNPSASACLVLIDYGQDVQRSRALIAEKGIEDHVVWLPKMYRKDIMYLLKNVDIGSGEFTRSFLTFGTIIEAMFMKKPVLNYRVDELYTQEYDELYPTYAVKEPEEIEVALSDAYSNPQKLKAMGLECYEWVRKYFIAKPIEELIKAIER
ncbi:MAG: glycosyltransferase [Flavipsychrobacter sp.]